ncbi:MAG: Clp protease ClpP [Candidatus Aminicenantes bacterium]|nr:Clp protease ClpP [Candidatus Aminicenantes bacterium]
MKWYEIKNKADKAEIWIYEYIGEDFWTGGGVTAKNFQKELAEIKASQIDLHINSPGGEVFDGITIYNLLKQHPAKITTYIDGLAASIASVIALAGDTVIMAENALFMIHNPTGMAMGTANDMRSLADVLDKIASTMIGTYTAKTGKSESDVKALLDAESWMTADEAKEFGFVDEIGEEMDLAACAKFVPAMAKAGFKRIPRTLNANRTLPGERELERILRDAGCSLKEAKAILAKGYDAHLRDVDPASKPPKAQEPPRDVEQPKPARVDKVAELIVRANLIAPSP